MELTFKRNDVPPPSVFQLLYSDGTVIDLTSCTVMFNLRLQNSLLFISRAAAVIDALEGMVSFAWQTGDFALSGTYQGEFEVTFPGGATRTVPSDSYIVITVYDDVENG